MMPAAAQRAGPGVLVAGHPVKQLDPTGPAPAELPSHHLVERTEGAPVERRQLPVELRARHVQRIAFRAEQDARGRVWRLLLAGHEVKKQRPAGWRPLSEACRRRARVPVRSEEHTSELQSRLHLVCRLLLEKKKNSRD